MKKCCTRTLTRVVPGIKAFGCCHEVFARQELLAELVGHYLPVEAAPARRDIRVNVTGSNHFTSIDRAFYGDVDRLALAQRHIEKPGTRRSCGQAEVERWNNYWRSVEQVKFARF